MIGVVGLAAVAAVVAGLDQLVKRSVVRRLAVGERRRLGPGTALAHVVNRRGGLVALPVPVAVGIGVGVAAVAVVLAGAADLGPLSVVGLGLVVGGALGNLSDRVRHGAVVDVLAVGRWPVFNLADAALVVGTGLVLSAAVLG